MNTAIEERFLKILAKTLEIKDKSLNVDVDLTSLGFNSISYIKLVVAAEEEFKIEFSDEDLDIGKFNSIKSVIAYIESKIGL